MRWPLYLTLNLCLILFMAAAAAGIIQMNGSDQAARSDALARELDGLIASWAQANVPPEKRVLGVLVSGEPDETLLDPPQPRRFWEVIPLWLRRGKSQAEHERLAAALLGNRRPMGDWYAAGRVWASERNRRLEALASYLAKAHQARARIVVVADGRQAPFVLAAIERASPSCESALVEKLIFLGTSPALLAYSRGEASEGKSVCVREALLLWHSEGIGVNFAGNQMELIDAQGRVIRDVLSGDAAKEKGAVALVLGLTDPGMSMADWLYRPRQITAGWPSPAWGAKSASPTGQASPEPSTKPAQGQALAPAAASVAGGIAVPVRSSGRTIRPPHGPLGGWSVAPPEGFKLENSADNDRTLHWSRSWRSRDAHAAVSLVIRSADGLFGSKCLDQPARDCITLDLIRRNGCGTNIKSEGDIHYGAQVEGEVTQGSQNGLPAYAYLCRLRGLGGWRTEDHYAVLGDQVLELTMLASGDNARKNALEAFYSTAASIRPPKP